MSSAGVGDRWTLSSRYLAIAPAVLFLLAVLAPRTFARTPEDEEVCDVQADYALGMEDYPEAIRLHLRVIEASPHDARAHYHLGFAYGMIGRHDRERTEYRTAVALGGAQWSLLLNLGLSYFDSGEYQAAIEWLKRATLIGSDRPETHYNLSLAYERRGNFPSAEQELTLSLALDPAQPEARNMLALVHAEEGEQSRAHREWTDLTRAYPDFEPARKNLAILDRGSCGSGVSSKREALVVAGENRSSDAAPAHRCSGVSAGAPIRPR